jgi:hypothetical protein
MESWKTLLIVMGICALFAYALLNGIETLQNQNYVNNSILNHPILQNFNINVTNNLNDLGGSVQKQSNATQSETSTIDVNPTGALTLVSITHSFLTFSGFIFGFIGTFFNLFGLLGISPLVVGVFVAILAMVAIFLFWRFIKIAQ